MANEPFIKDERIPGGRAIAEYKGAGILRVDPAVMDEIKSKAVPDARKSMPVFPYAGLDEWREMGPMGNVKERSFDRSRDFESYAGNDDRPTPIRPPQAYVMAAFRDHPLAMKDRPFGMSSSQAGASLAEHYGRILGARDEGSLRLLRIAAQIGGRAAVEAGEMRAGRDDYDAATAILHDRLQGSNDADMTKKNREAFVKRAVWAMQATPAMLEKTAELARLSPDPEAAEREVAAERVRLFNRRDAVLKEIKDATAGMTTQQVKNWESRIKEERAEIGARDSKVDSDKARKASEATREEISDAQGSVGAAGSMPSPFFTVVAVTAGEAKAMRGLIDYALTLMPPAKGYESQKMLKSVDDLPPAEDMLKASEGWKDRPSPSRFLDSKTLEPRLVVGVVAGYGYKAAETAARRMQASKHPVIFALDQNPALWSAASRYPSEQKTVKLGEGSRNPMMAMKTTIEQADAMMVVWNGKTEDASYKAIAMAARRGNLTAVYNDSGDKLDHKRLAAQAIADIPSERTWKMRSNENVFDIPASDPEARFAASMIRNEKLGSVKPMDIYRLAETGMTLSDVVEMAREDAGRARLVREFKLSPNAAKLFGDDEALHRAREGFEQSSKALANENVRVIGAESYPASLLAAGASRIPPFLFAKGDVSVLMDGRPMIGLVQSDNIKKEFAPTIESGLPRLMAGAREAGAVLVQLEPASRDIRPDMTPDILLTGSGVDQGTDRQTANREAVLAAGGLVLSILPPTMAGVIPNKKQKGAMSPNWSKDEGLNARGRAADLLGHMADVVVVPSMHATNREDAHRVVEAALDIDRRPAVFNQKALEGFPEVSGNQAILRSDGPKGLRSSGISEVAVSRLEKTVESGPMAIDVGPRPDIAAINLVRVASGLSVEKEKEKEAVKEAAPKRRVTEDRE